jgi:hypothetical protein
MPEKRTLQRARRDKRQGKSASTQAGEFIREEIHHIREGKHGAKSAKQAIAIGLSKARRSGVKLKPQASGEASEKTRRSAARAYQRGQGAPARAKTSAKRARASKRALEREPRSAASHQALAKQARASARKRGPAKRSMAARKAAHTRAHTRQMHAHA